MRAGQSHNGSQVQGKTHKLLQKFSYQRIGERFSYLPDRVADAPSSRHCAPLEDAGGHFPQREVPAQYGMVESYLQSMKQHSPAGSIVSYGTRRSRPASPVTQDYATPAARSPLSPQPEIEF